MIQVSITGGSENIEINEKVMTYANFSLVTPADSNARSTDQYTQLILKGKIVPSVASVDGEPTVALDKWAAVTDDKLEAYRSVSVKVTEASVVLREYTLPSAYVVNYKVDYSDTEGNGLFTLQVRQKKDKTKDTTVEGGFGI